MSFSQVDDIEEVIVKWKRLYKNRADGGIQAIGGFNYQTWVFLDAFLKRELDGSPYVDSRVEALSDILLQDSGFSIAIQVKTTLKTDSLCSAVVEACLIADICKRFKPDLLNTLCFQIVCSSLKTNRAVQDIQLSELARFVGKAKIDQVLLDITKQMFASESIAVRKDPHQSVLDQMKKMNLDDSNDLAMKWFGIVHDRAGTRGDLKLEEDLRQTMELALRTKSWSKLGTVLSKNDLVAPMDKKLVPLLPGQRPPLYYFGSRVLFERPILQDVLLKFEEWLQDIERNRFEGSAIPVFWISGRSGEGKSVLLVQTVAKLIAEGKRVIRIESGDDLPSFLRATPGELGKGQQIDEFVYLYVDDIYDVLNRDTWDRQFETVLRHQNHRFAIVTCGPTEQGKEFVSRLGKGIARVKFIEVPQLENEEFLAFIDWYESLTGKRVDRELLTLENPMLVQLMFEISHGSSIDTFARSFKRRLQRMKIYEQVRQIFALNALYLDAPIEILPTDELQDQIRWLCNEDQLHLRFTHPPGIEAIGVRVAHAHITYQILLCWLRSESTFCSIGEGWARSLSVSMELSIDKPSALDPSELLITAISTSRLQENKSEEGLQSLRTDFFKELYRLHIYLRNGEPTHTLVSRWLEAEVKIPSLRIGSRSNGILGPLDFTLKLLADEVSCRQLPAYVLGWLWLRVEREPLENDVEWIDKCGQSLLDLGATAGVAFTLCRLVAKGRNKTLAVRLSMEWLDKNITAQQSDNLIAVLIKNAPSAEVDKLAQRWLEGNDTSSQVPDVICAMLAAEKVTLATVNRAADWTNTHHDEDALVRVFQALVGAGLRRAEFLDLATDLVTKYVRMRQSLRSNQDSAAESSKAQFVIGLLLTLLVKALPHDDEIKQMSIQHIQQDPTSKNHSYLLSTMIRTNAEPEVEVDANKETPTAGGGRRIDPEIERLAIEWVKANCQESMNYLVLGPLLKARKDESLDVVQLALDVVQRNLADNWTSRILMSIFGSPHLKDKVKEVSIKWIKFHKEFANVHIVVAPFARTYPGDLEAIDAMVDWAKSPKNNYNLYFALTTMVKANPTDEKVIDLARQWLEDHKGHSRQTLLLKTLIAQVGGKEWMNYGVNYVENPHMPKRHTIVETLLPRSSGAVEILDLALVYLECSQDKKTNSGIRRIMEETLSRNPGRREEYLEGDFPKARKTMLRQMKVIQADNVQFRKNDK